MGFSSSPVWMILKRMPNLWQNCLAWCKSLLFRLGESAITPRPFTPRNWLDRYRTRAESTPPEKAVRLPSTGKNQASSLSMRLSTIPELVIPPLDFSSNIDYLHRPSPGTERVVYDPPLAHIWLYESPFPFVPGSAGILSGPGVPPGEGSAQFHIFHYRRYFTG